MLKEAESGLIPVKPGDPTASELIVQITPDANGEVLMPKTGAKLTPPEIDLLRRWIAEGAKVDAASDRPTFDREHPPIYAAPPTVSALDVSPDGKLLAVSGVNETLLLDAEAAAQGKPSIVHRLIGMSERIESVRFSPDGARLAVAGGFAGEQGELQIWDVATGELVLSHLATSDSLHGVAWSPDGKNVAFGGADTDLYVIDAETGNQKLDQGAHSDWVLAAAFSTDGKYLVSGSRDQTLKLVEAETGRFVDNITAVSPNVISGQIFAVARHPGRDMVAIGGSEGVPRTYMFQRVVERKIGDDSNLVRAYPPMPGRVYGVAFNPAGTQLAVASSDAEQGYLQIFAVPDAFLPPDDIKLIQGKAVADRTAEEKTRLEANTRQGAVRTAYASTRMPPQYAVAFTPDGKTVVTAGADGLVRFHNAVHGTLVAKVNPYPMQTAANVTPSKVDTTSDVLAAGANEPPIPNHIEFLTDVMPQLGKLGCNAGTCHGARAGQNGFCLSLRGYNPLADHAALTDDLAARRINRAKPEASLMLMKPSGGVPHGGGQVLQPGTRRYEILRRWIAEGAVYNADAPRVVGIEVAPQNPIVDKPGDTIQMRITARYSDGSSRDVTADAFIDSGNTECATADAAGVLTAVRRGEAPVLARFEGSYAATTLTVMGDREGYEWAPQPAYNHIDELVDVKLQRMKINASPVCSDAQFIRRAYLDLTGLPPSAEQVRAFLADQGDVRGKRSALVDRLIGSEDYIEHWTNRWADLLMVNSRFLGAEGANKYREWIRQAVAENKPYDKFVYELFTSTGSNREHPGGSYFKVLRAPELIAETSTQVFMGVRFNCNKCHDHPFERWTQNDYYGWAAFFADVKLEKDPASGDQIIPGSAVEDAKPLFEMITDGTGGQEIHLRTGKVAPPKFPFAAGDADKEASVPVLRQRAAQWLTSPDNRYFATSHVNRVWAQLTGAGLIEPIDDIRAGNPPTNPELLQYLTQEFIKTDFDNRALIRLICQSRTYQLSGETNRFNDDDRRNYSHALPRRLPAEALYDAVYRVVGSISHLPGMPPGSRAAALPDSMMEVESGLLGKLGRPARESGCECERSSDLQLGPVMALINGPTFADAIDDPDSELAKLEAAMPDNAALAREVFVRVLGRDPSESELAGAVHLLSDPGAEHGQAAAAFEARVEALEPGFETWRKANRPISWTNLQPVTMTATIGSQFAAQDDGAILVTGENGKCVYQLVMSSPRKQLMGLRLEVLADDSLPGKGPGRALNGNFVLNRLKVFAASADHPEQRRPIKIRQAQADFSQAGFDIAGAIDNKPATGWAVAPEMGKSHTAVFTFVRPIKLRKHEVLVVELDQQYDDNHTLGRFRLAATRDDAPLMRPDHGGDIQPLLAAKHLSGDETARLRTYYYSQDSQYRALERAQRLLANPRLAAVQDLAWALINSPAFLFNH
jgi:WD40 repeat protein